jgi:hypothetical protein
MKKLKDEAGFGIIGLLLSVLILGFLYYFMMKNYLNPPNKDLKSLDGVAAEGIDTRSYQGMVKSAKDKVEQLNQKIAQNDEQMKKMLDKYNSGSGEEPSNGR